MIRIEIADSITLPACLALLRVSADPRCRHWVARVAGEVVGAGALRWQTLAQAPMPGPPSPHGFAASVLVREEWRRRGIGRLLLDAMAEAAIDESDGLWSSDRHSDNSPAAQFLVQCGFTGRQRDLHFQMSLPGCLHHLEPIVTRLRSSGRVPANAAVVRLREAPLMQTAMLVASNFGQRHQDVAARLQLALANPVASRIDADRSVVITEDDTVVGAVLLDIIGPTLQVDCILVAPHRRHSYVIALQLYSAAQRCVAIADRIAFHCDDRQFHTVNLAARGGADLVRSEARYWRPMLP